MSYGDPANVLFMQDGQSPDPWWASPDITIPGNQVTGGVANTISVRGRKNPVSLSGDTVTIEAFISTPGLQMNPPQAYNTPFTRKLGEVDIAVSALTPAGATTPGATTPITFNAPSTVPDNNDAFGPGHRCLVGRIYPFGFTPPGNVFTFQTEQHEVLHNVMVANVTLAPGVSGAGGAGQGDAGTDGAEPLGPNEDGFLEFRVDTTTRRAKAEQVLLRTTWANLRPAAELRSLAGVLKKRRGFRGLAKQRPSKFRLRFDIPKDELAHAEGQRPYVPKILGVKDRTGAKYKEPRYEATVRLQPKKIARIGITADLRASRVGQAHVFYVEQLGPNAERHGGLTLVFLRIR
jgi:hypothetical protein